MTREKLISLIAEYKKELYGKVDINSLKEWSLPLLEADFIREAFYLLKKRASNEFANLMKNNYESDYTKLNKNISEISIKAYILNRLFELKLDELPSSLEMAILLEVSHTLDILWKEYTNNHININIANFSYILSLLSKSIEKNNSTYYADITIKSHSRMDQPIFLSVNGNCENIRDIAIDKVGETLSENIDQKFECYISFYSKHIIEDKTVFLKTEAFEITVVNNEVLFSTSSY